MKYKDRKDFIKYLEEHPQERFFQAVRNFSGYEFIFAGHKSDMSDAIDTFYLEDI